MVNAFVALSILQNGSILVFDMRRNICPLQSIGGLTSEPIHTIHSLMCNPFHSASAGKLLTASSIGPCVWDTGDSGKRLVYIEFYVCF